MTVLPRLLDRATEWAAPARMGTAFRWNLASSWVAQLGDGIALAAGPLLVGSLTRDPTLIAAAAMVQNLPTLLLGLYAGAVGYLDFAGNLDFCIAIRTVIMSAGKAYVQAGAGIVMDSNPTAEYEETRDKAQALLRALDLAQQGL